MSDVVTYMSEATKMARLIDGLPDKITLRPIKKVGIIGAGTMGGGIAMNFATAGIPVTIVENREDALTRGLDIVRNNYQRSADRGRFAQDEVDVRMARIEGALEIEKLVDEYDRDIKQIKQESLKLAWYMRGGLSYTEAMHLSIDERKIINEIIKENLETTKKTKMPFF